MNIYDIKDPSFLRRLDIHELEQLAQSIRTFLIEEIAKTGGHLGANLGVVELTIALHHVYKSPIDKLIWDVGHQSYIHKILTGRASQFKRLRQFKGLSGFIRRDENPHDIWEAGHSSTSISSALGMAIARDLNGEEFDVVSIIGDGALTGGMAFEALNHIGDLATNMTIVLNDNGMSISKNVGAVKHILDKARSMNEKNEPAYFFEQLGLHYLGPINGHNIMELITALKDAQTIEGPVIVHVLTEKGKGYLPAENNTIDHWHGVGPYDKASGKQICSDSDDTKMSWSETISNHLVQEAFINKKFVVITPAMILGSKLEVFQQQFPKRIFDVGIAEQHAITLAAGIATTNVKPVVLIYSTFLQRAYDQVVHDVCRQNLNVLFGIDRAGLVGADGDTHHGVFDIAYLRALPNMTIMMPVSSQEAKAMIRYALNEHTGPIAIRYPRGNAPNIVHDSVAPIQYGKWTSIQEGKDCAVITFGSMLELALDASQILQKKGIHISIINARFIKPLDEQILHRLFTDKVPVITIEEAILAGGFGSSVLEFIETNNYASVLMKCLGIEDTFIEHGTRNELLAEIGLTKERLVDEVVKLLERKERRKDG